MLPHLEFADMPYSGLLATVFSGLEPAVAITLACIPFLRPVLRGESAIEQSSHYEVSHGSHATSRKATRVNDSRAFEELNDNSSEIQLRPIKGEQDVRVSASPASNEENIKPNDSRFITIQKKWEVRMEQ